MRYSPTRDRFVMLSSVSKAYERCVRKLVENTVESDTVNSMDGFIQGVIDIMIR